MSREKYPIDEAYIGQFINDALWEDVRTGDVTSLACIPPGKRSRARLKIKADGVIAGLEFALRVFQITDPASVIHFFKNEGDEVRYGEIAFEVEADCQAILKSERLVLNTMQRMSGIATLSRQYALEVADLPVHILDTRKTTPLFRYFEKWAVHIGGCENYRVGLYDRFMIKDNHADACGSISKALEQVDQFQRAHGIQLGVTVEVRNLDELAEVLRVGKTTRIMLDNFQTHDMAEAVQLVRKRFEVEASGGVDLTRLREIALTGVDYISSGALTHSAASLDLSLKIIKD